MGETFSELEGILLSINENHQARNLMGAFTRVIQFELDGEQNRFAIIINHEQMRVVEGDLEEADIVICGDSSKFAEVVRGEIDITHPIARGEITLKKGKISEMTLLNRILLSVKRR